MGVKLRPCRAALSTNGPSQPPPLRAYVDFGGVATIAGVTEEGAFVFASAKTSRDVSFAVA
jgi:hypothetical protein